MKRRNLLGRGKRFVAIAIVLSLALTGGAPAAAAAAELPSGEEVMETAAGTEEEALSQEGSLHFAQTKPSKVIGLKGRPSYDSGSMASGEKYYYTSPRQLQYSVVVKGTADTKDADGNVTVPGTYKDAQTGLYKYNDTYYQYCSKTELDGFVELGGVALVKSGKPETYRDAATGFYKVDGATYTWMGSTPVEGFCYVSPSSAVEVISVVDSYEAAENLKKTYAVLDTNGDTLYYKVNGVLYTDIDADDVWVNDQDKVLVYVYKYNEMLLDKSLVYLSWNDITDDTVLVNKDGVPMSIGYELEVNGSTIVPSGIDGSFLDEKDGTLHNLVDYSGRTIPYVVVGSGETVSVRVRAVYYHKTDVIYDTDEGPDVWQREIPVYVADMYGEWSDPYTYTGESKKIVPAVTGLTAARSSNDVIEVRWNNVEAADSYSLRYIRSAKPLTAITDAASFAQFYFKSGALYDAFLASGGKEDDIDARTIEWIHDNYETISASKEKPYCYLSVSVGDAAEGYLLDGKYADPVSVIVQAAANTPQIQNFKVIKTDNGNGASLSWTPVDAKMAIYLIKGTSIPKYYNHAILNAYGIYKGSDGSESKVNLYDNMTDKERGAIITSQIKFVSEIDGEDGEYDLYYNYNYDDDFYFEPGVKYTFVAFTYDDDEEVNKVEKAPLGTVNYRTPVTQDNNRTIVEVPVNLTYYTATGKEAKATYTPNITRPSVSYATTGTSVKLSMSASNYTGFEIWRLSGKKYKKIASTTERSYTDTGLKEDTKYSYKVRAYYYDADTKKTSYSEYRAVSVTTSDTKNFTAKVTKLSKTSAKVTWTKVSGAAKYEIYRASGTARDPSVISKQLDSGNYATALSNAKYKLLKTVNKASTVSYTDKGLKSGESYNYLVIAHYTSEKKDAIMTGGGSVVMELQTPQNVTATRKGKKVTVKWDADKFASKYELRWKITDKYGKQARNWKTATVKSTSKSISIGSGESLTVQVRAYGSNKTYSDWSRAYATDSLAAVSNIKAVNDEKTGAVKITWKKVSGAKYYVVRRSTYMPVYNADDKRYIASGSYIAKESNDDKGYASEVYYKDYYGVSGSVTKTTAYDYAQLDSGVTYYYTVVAYGEKGSGIASYTTDFDDERTLASGKPASVVYGAKAQIASLKNSRKGQVAVKFNKVTGANKYEVYRATKKNGAYTLVGSTKKTTFTDKKAIKKGTTYYYKVVAKGKNALKADFSLESAVKSVKVKK